ncbi:DoxX family protein [Geminicoccus harenae]|uniref:DoxX family protein n=1 Tax=Geminicoccus harenae TaxID=2498453 RepID=UPI00168AE165|nr:DoxX family protein [Geminicoccus harenae]
MPRAIGAILHNSWFGYLARTVLTFMFWMSGLVKLLDFQGGVAEMAHFGLEPAVLFNLATIVVQLGGSALVILNRWTWLGAGALAVFTVLTIPIAHHFWTMEEPFRTLEFFFVMEHITVVGALMVVAWASVLHRVPARRTGDGQAPASVAGRQRPEVEEAGLA